MNSSTVSDRRPVAVVGAGHMGEALVKGLLRGRTVTAAQVRVSDVDPRRLAHLRAAYGVRATTANAACVRRSGLVILAVKPQGMADVLRDIRPALPRDALVVSIAAGRQTAWLERRLPPGTRVVRVMPNLPAVVGCGVSVYCLGRRARPQDGERVRILFRSVGRVFPLAERHLDAVTALSGSGPAYVCVLADLMIAAGAAMGLDPDVARRLTLETLRGTVRYLIQERLDPGDLCRRVTSPGGTTEAAIRHLAAGRVRQRFIAAIRRAGARAGQLSEGA